MNKREFLSGTASGVAITVAQPFFWIPDAEAQARGEVRDQLIEAQNGTFNETNMDRLLARAANATDVGTGASGATIRRADAAMSSNFPDDSRSYVYGAGSHTIFYRFDSSSINFCAAWIYEDTRVCLMEGPILVALVGCMEDMTEYSQNRGYGTFRAREFTRGFCAPVEARRRFEGTFQSVSQSPDDFVTEYTRVEIEYRRMTQDRRYGEARYAVWDLDTRSVVYEGSRQIRLLTT